MKFESKLVEAVLLKRYKRFFADVEILVGSKKEIHVAHVPNTGSLKGCLTEGQKCLIEPSSNPERKLKWTLQAIQVGRTWVGVNTSNPGKVLKEAFDVRKLEHWTDYNEIKPEIKISKETRLDFLLTKKNSKGGVQKLSYVEVKNVTMAEDQKGHMAAMFPDSVTERGLKHLHELIELKKQGHDAEILFLIQRNDCDYFTVAEHVDKKYAEGLRLAQKAKVRISAVETKVTPTEILLTGRLLNLKGI